MHKLRSILVREALLLLRDIPGLFILFFMPVLLIFVVTLAQENALKYQRERTSVLVVDQKPSLISREVCKALDSSGFFTVVRQVPEAPLTPELASGLIAQGKYKFGIDLDHPDSTIRIWVDPTLDQGYRTSILNSLQYLIKSVQARLAMNEIIDGLSGELASVIRVMAEQKQKSLPPMTCLYPSRNRESIVPNVIQNNVPGFILFAMFFIVIPLSGSLITEKNEGSYLRLRTLPVRLLSILSGKVIIYFLVCLLQFLLILWIGKQVFPLLFGFPPLVTGSNNLAIAITTFGSALAAIGFGMIIGSVATTHGQAAMFGSVIVVLLGVISGVFLPVHLLPEAIRVISLASPLRWGIDNYLDLFVRNGTLCDIVPRTLSLMGFFGLAMFFSIVIFAKRK